MNSLFYFGFIILSIILIFFAGVKVGQDSMKKSLELQATQNCGAEYNIKTGEFSWVKCKKLD